MADNDVKQLARDRYGQEARRVLSGTAASGAGDAVSGDLYGEADAAAVPAEALKASLGWATRRLWPSSSPARSYSTWVRAAALTCRRWSARSSARSCGR